MTLVLKDTGPLSEACFGQEQGSDALRQRMASPHDRANCRVQLPIRDVQYGTEVTQAYVAEWDSWDNLLPRPRPRVFATEIGVKSCLLSL